jgi:hypothetical protein
MARKEKLFLTGTQGRKKNESVTESIGRTTKKHQNKIVWK